MMTPKCGQPVGGGLTHSVIKEKDSQTGNGAERKGGSLQESCDKELNFIFNIQSFLK